MVHIEFTGKLQIWSEWNVLHSAYDGNAHMAGIVQMSVRVYGGNYISVEEHENERQLVNVEWIHNYSPKKFIIIMDPLLAFTMARLDRRSTAFFFTIDHA